MSDKVLNINYKPQSGGWNRLCEKIEISDKADVDEAKMWRNVVAALVFAFLLIPIYQNLNLTSSSFNYSEPVLGEVQVTGGQAIPVAHSIKGVRFYWLFIETAEAKRKQQEQ